MKAQFLEPEVNREASDFVVNNYPYLLKQAPKFGVPEEKAGDLINEVWVSLVQAEDRGDGYDINRGEDLISVKQFVYGRIKRYAMNNKFRTDVVEKGGSKTNSVEVVASSTADSSDYDTMDSFQKAYATAASYDDIEDVDDKLSIREQLNYCISFSADVDMDMLSVFQNMDLLSSPNIHKSFFDPLREALKYHDEFREAFNEVLAYSMRHHSSFESILATL